MSSSSQLFASESSSPYEPEFAMRWRPWHSRSRLRRRGLTVPQPFLLVWPIPTHNRKIASPTVYTIYLWYVYCIHRFPPWALYIYVYIYGIYYVYTVNILYGWSLNGTNELRREQMSGLHSQKVIESVPQRWDSNIIDPLWCPTSNFLVDALAEEGYLLEPVSPVQYFNVPATVLHLPVEPSSMAIGTTIAGV